MTYIPISDEKIEQRMIHLPAEIKECAYIAIKLKVEWLNAKAQLNRNFAKAMAVAKATDSKLTQTDLKAIAEEKTFEESLKVIGKEAEYRNAQADKDELKDGLYSLEGVSSTRRASGYQQRNIRTE